MGTIVLDILELRTTATSQPHRDHSLSDLFGLIYQNKFVTTTIEIYGSFQFMKRT